MTVIITVLAGPSIIIINAIVIFISYVVIINKTFIKTVMIIIYIIILIAVIYPCQTQTAISFQLFHVTFELRVTEDIAESRSQMFFVQFILTKAFYFI